MSNVFVPRSYSIGDVLRTLILVLSLECLGFFVLNVLYL